jgi:hypothetical protein
MKEKEKLDKIEKERLKEEEELKKEALKKQVKEKEKKLGKLIKGMKCMWRYQKVPERLCSSNRGTTNFYFCSAHARYGGANNQAEIIENLITDTFDKFYTKQYKEMSDHLDFLKAARGDSLSKKSGNKDQHPSEKEEEEDITTLKAKLEALEKKLTKTREKEEIKKPCSRKKAAPKGKVKTKLISDSDSSDSDDSPKKPSPKKAVITSKENPKRKAIAKKKPVSDSEESIPSSSDEDEKPKAKKVPPPVLKKRAIPKKKVVSESEDSD